MKTVLERLSHAMNHNKKFCMTEQVTLIEAAYLHVKELEGDVNTLEESFERCYTELQGERVRNDKLEAEINRLKGRVK